MRPKTGPALEASPASEKQIRQAHDASKFDSHNLVWRFGALDIDGPWGWKNVAGKYWWPDIFPKLKNFETMTWGEIFQASGGRREGNNHHPVDVRNLTKQASARLSEINQDDIDYLFSLRLTNTWRIYGIREMYSLKLLWFDPYHGNNSKAVYPVKSR